MIYIKRLVLIIMSAFMFMIVSSFFITPKTNGYDLVNKDVCQNAPDSPACKNTNSDVLSGKDGIIIKVTRIVAYIAGIAAVIVIMLGGYKIILSGGKSENITKGREMITYAAIGLIIVIIAQSIVTFVISKI